MEKIKVQELKTLLKNAFSNKPGVNFTKEEAQTAAVNGLLAYYGIDGEMSIRQLRKIADMAIIEEVIDEVLPAQLEDILGDWAEIKQFGRDEEVKFTIKNIGKQRALLSIVPGARGGIYKARRLDDKNLFIRTEVYTAGVFVTLEDILLGKMTLVELLDNILLGILYQVYKNVVAALRAAKNLVPSANKSNGADIITASVDKLIRIASAYGSPVLVGFQSLVTKFSNVKGTSNPNVSVKDVDEIRNAGFVSVYKGTPIIRIPNFLRDETNAAWVFSEADLFILPSNGKIVKVAMQGEGYSVETQHPGGSAETNYHKIMGTAILTYNNFCIYTDDNIATAETAVTGLV